MYICIGCWPHYWDNRHCSRVCGEVDRVKKISRCGGWRNSVLEGRRVLQGFENPPSSCLNIKGPRNEMRRTKGKDIIVEPQRTDEINDPLRHVVVVP